MDNHVYIFPSEILEKFPPIYRNAFIEMLFRYHKASNPFQQLQILQDFSSIFVLLPIFWKTIKNLKKNLLNQGIPLPELFSFRKMLTFSSKKYAISDNLDIKIDLQTWRKTAWNREWNDEFMNEPEKLLNFPHNLLEDALYFVCLEQSVKPIEEKIFFEGNRLLKLYNQFTRDDLSHDEWVLYLNEIKDEEVIIGLFEHRLGGKYGCFDKNIWKFYMNFLKEKDLNYAYLKLYQRYTRFFIEDKQMVEEYRNEIERISSSFKEISVAEFWIDTILYEIDFRNTNTKNTAIKILKRALKSVNIPYQNYKNLGKIEMKDFGVIFKMILQEKNSDIFVKNLEEEEEGIKKVPSKKSKISCYFPKNQISALKKSQNFSFHQNLIYFITQKVKTNHHRLLQKLFNCCKYFFAVQPTPLCYRLFLGCDESSKYRGHSLFLNDKDIINNNFQGLDNLYITHCFDILSGDPTVSSRIFKRMYKCEAICGKIDAQEFTLEEFKFIQDQHFADTLFNAYGSYIVEDGVKYLCHPNNFIKKLISSKNV